MIDDDNDNNHNTNNKVRVDKKTKKNCPKLHHFLIFAETFRKTTVIVSTKKFNRVTLIANLKFTVRRRNHLGARRNFILIQGAHEIKSVG